MQQMLQDSVYAGRQKCTHTGLLDCLHTFAQTQITLLLAVYPPTIVLHLCMSDLWQLLAHTHCGALRFPRETLNCCHSGKVCLCELMSFPDPLKHLLSGDTSAVRTNFLDNIREYNSAFAFASMGAQVVPPPGHSPYCFRIHGQVYHRTGSLHPPDGVNHQYAQVYILERDQAVESRMQHSENQNCKPDTLRLLLAIMDEYNRYVSVPESFCRLSEYHMKTKKYV